MMTSCILLISEYRPLYSAKMSLAIKLLCLAAAVTQAAATSSSKKILLFTGTAGFRHDSIPTAVQTISSKTGWTTIHTESATYFENLDNLKQFDALVFVHTTDKDPPEVGAPLTEAGAVNVGKYMQQGGNFVGVHSATNTLYAYPFYGRMIGAFFDYHNQLGPMVSFPFPGRVAAMLTNCIFRASEPPRATTPPRKPFPPRSTSLKSSIISGQTLASCRPQPMFSWYPPTIATRK